MAETGARAVHWMRAYDPLSRERDADIKTTLVAEGATAQSHAGAMLFEPWDVRTGAGSYFKVFTPMWKAIRSRDPGAPLPVPGRIEGPLHWPVSLTLADLDLGRDMRRGGDVVARYCHPGETAAQDRLAGFMADQVTGYGAARDAPGADGTSGLAEYLALGEISARQIWAAGQRHMEAGVPGVEPFLRQLAWRDFASHLMYHTPHILTGNWRAGWDRFPWNTDGTRPEVMAWKQGRTGVDFVDAAMREMHVTGRMHNRGRMVVASYLTKHLLTDWRIGMDWFARHLTDWDAANNAMGWQWVAGCGPDAAPYFRIFNPDTQLDKFDPGGVYRRRWIAEGTGDPDPRAMAFFEAIPRRWGMRPEDARPAPVVALKQGRERALEAYERIRA